MRAVARSFARNFDSVRFMLVFLAALIVCAGAYLTIYGHVLNPLTGTDANRTVTVGPRVPSQHKPGADHDA